jgi:L-amino acid N-acyltransferase YncA
VIRALQIGRDWKALKMDIPLTSDTGGMVLEKDGKIVAAGVFDGWTYNAVFMHMMTTNMREVMRSGFLNEVFDYIFTTTGKKKAVGLIPSNHKPSLRLAKRFGFAEKARIEDGFDEGNDLVILELKRENCPYWTGAEHEKSTKAA